MARLLSVTFVIELSEWRRRRRRRSDFLTGEQRLGARGWRCRIGSLQTSSRLRFRLITLMVYWRKHPINILSRYKDEVCYFSFCSRPSWSGQDGFGNIQTKQELVQVNLNHIRCFTNCWVNLFCLGHPRTQSDFLCHTSGMGSS